MRRVLVLFAATVGMVLAGSTGALADVSGGCSLTATTSSGNTSDLATTATWHVNTTDTVVATATLPSEQHHLAVQMFMYGLPITLQTAAGSTLGGAHTIYVSNYSWLARIFAMSGTSDSCSGSVTAVVDDKPAWATLVGGLGLVIGVLAMLALLAVMRFGGALAGGLLGAVSGLGFGLFLQQTGGLDPRSALDLLVPFAGLVLGAVLSLRRPSRQRARRREMA